MLFTVLFCTAGVQKISAQHVKHLERHPLPMDKVYEQGEALSLLNEKREAMGMNTLILNDQLEQAAQAHANYLVWNHKTSHREIPGLKGFTGRTPSDRAFYAGYFSSQVSENLSTGNPDAQSSIDGLFSAIYHRFGFLDVSIDEIGVGVAQNGTDTEESAFVYLMGNSRLNDLCKEPAFKGYGKYVYHVCRDADHRIAEKRFLDAKYANSRYNPRIILYPYDGQRDVIPVFFQESPDPLPDYEVSGFPVSVTFNPYYFKTVQMYSFKLYEAGGREVFPVRVLSRENDPNSRFSAYEFALFPMKRLKFDTQYRAEIVYRYRGKKEKRSWTFHTKRPEEPLLRIEKPEATVTLAPHKTYLLYLVPLDGHNVIKSVQYPEDVDVRFYDNNTLRITVMSGRGKAFILKTPRHRIHVKVK